MSGLVFNDELEIEKIEKLIAELDSTENNFNKFKSFITRNKKDIQEVSLYTSLKAFIKTIYSSETVRRVEDGHLYIMASNDFGFLLTPIVVSLNTMIKIELIIKKSNDKTYRKDLPIKYYTGLNFYESQFYERRFKLDSFDFDENKALIEFQKQNIRKFTSNKLLLKEIRIFLDDARKNAMENEKKEVLI